MFCDFPYFVTKSHLVEGCPVVDGPDATVSIRNKETMAEYSTDWGLATSDLLSAAMPWRTFRWHRGQKHYSGFPPRPIGVADCCCR